MATTVTYKPLSTLAGEANWTKTVAANAYTALNDNLDTTFIKRTSTTAGAGLKVPLDVSSKPAGKNLNRWKMRLRHNRPTSGSKVTIAVKTYDTTGITVKEFASATYVGVFAGPNWQESGYYPGTLDPPNDTSGIVNTVSIYLADTCAASADRSTFYEAWMEAEYVDPPTCTVTAPSGTVTDTNYPTITWTFATTESNPQSQAVVKVFDSATYGAAGFNAATSTPVWSKTVTGSQASVAVDAPLGIGGTYRAYVLVAEDTGYITSNAVAYAFSTFTLSLTTPALPTISAAFLLASNSVSFQVQGHTNLLTANQSSLETNTTGWAVGTNCTIARSTAQFLSGVASLSLTSVAGGDMYAVTTTGTGGVPVIASEIYTAVAYFRTAVSARSCRVDISWYNAAGTLISTSTAGSVVADASGAWSAAVSVSDTAPALSAFAAVRVNVLAAGAASEVHYVDQIAIYPGIAATSVNLCSNPSFESGTAGWLGSAFGYTTSTIATTATFAQHGTQGLLVTWPNASANTSCVVYAATGLTIGQQYTFSGYVRVPSGGSPKVAINELFGTAASQSSVLQDTGSTTNAFLALDRTFTATATTHFLGFVNAAAATSGQTAVIDAAQLEVGPVRTTFSVPAAAWSIGGYTSPAIILERSNDGGASWIVVRRAVADVVLNGGVIVTSQLQRYTGYDQEAARPGTVLYRAQAVGASGALVVSSGYTANYTVTTMSDGMVWLKAVADSTLNDAVNVRRGSLDIQIDEDLGVFRPLGRGDVAVVVAGDMYGHDGALTIITKTVAEYEDALALAKHQGVLLLQETILDSAGRGLQRWIRATGSRTVHVLDNPALRDVSLTFVDVGPD